ncbi:MAG: hypothetical protein IK104_07545 [Clostridia bacterium]|nr:hypothetical protein [Clostridia bacterium]
MDRPDYLNEIRNRIKAEKYGSVFVATDFADITENVKIGVCLSRLEEEKTLLRIMRGVYYKPEYSSLLGEYIAPAPDAVAHAIARNFGWTIVPCGDTALNLLGLSTQVPAAWVYVSDGPYKEYAYGDVVIKFKRTANKDISHLSFKTALTIQALKALGKEHITDSVTERLKRILSEKEQIKMLIEAKATTAWVYKIIKTICS